MAEEKICPSCRKAIDQKVKKCPNCQKQLEILYWEVEQHTGEKVLYSGEKAEVTIRENLIAGTLQLTYPCRQYVTLLKGVANGEDQYESLPDMGWKTLRDYADEVYALQVLYSPVMADGKRVAQQVWVLAGFVVAIAWNASPLLAIGVNPFVAILISIGLLILTPTIVGIAVGSVVVGGIYGFPPFGMAVRTGVAILVGAVVGGLISWTLGFAIGAIIGLTKKKMVLA